MIIIERQYQAWNSEFNRYDDETERKVFTDVEYEAVQEFINQEGEYVYTKL